MTREELEQRIKDRFDGDPEGDHAELDDLWFDVLKFIADCEGGHYAELARVAVDAVDKVPTRWYA